MVLSYYSLELRQLRQEILRYTRLMKSVKPRDIVEAMRNRWASQLDENYAAQVNKLIRSMVEQDDLKLSVDGRTLNRRTIRERAVGNLVFEDPRALLAGEQTVTFRPWAVKVYANYNQGDIITAQDRRGKPVATIKITQTPYKKMSNQIRVSDWVSIGFDYRQKMSMRINGKTPWEVWQEWVEEPDYLWIIRFEMLEIIA